MKPIVVSACLLLVLALLGVSGVRAESGLRFYLAPGVGIGGAGSETGFAYGFNTSILIGRAIISVREIGCRQLLNILGPEFSSSDYSVLAGIRTWDAEEQASIEGGVGYVRISDQGKLLIVSDWFGPAYEQIHQSALGLALQAQFYHRGTGLVIYGNVNKVQSFGGLMLCLRFGRW